ncbi:MAG: hypothetical protein WBX15_01845 [Thermoanaerobaculia bacterium]
MIHEEKKGFDMPGFFERRKRIRRLRMIIELTQNLLRTDDSLTHRQARCLVDCARKSILDLFPHYLDDFDRRIRPRFERMIGERWPEEESLYEAPTDQMVN